MARDLDELKEILDQTRPRSPWTMYLRRNFPAFKETIAGSAPDWLKIAQWAERRGHTGGEPILPETARRAYERERVRREGKRPKKVLVTSLKPASDPAPGVRIIPPDAPEPVRVVAQPAQAMSKPTPAQSPADFLKSMDPDWARKKEASKPASGVDALERLRQQMRRPWDPPVEPLKPAPSSIDDDLSAQLDAGRQWLPKPGR